MPQAPHDWVAKLAAEHGRMVFAVAYRVLGNADDAEDAAQEVFLKLLRGAVDPERTRNWQAYLKTMASTASIDLLRRHRGGKPIVAEWLDALPAPEREIPDRMLELREKADLLRSAIARLPARDAEIFSLRHFEELTYEEIGAQLDLNPSLVGVALHRARARLAELLKPWTETSRKDHSHERLAARKSRV